MTGNSLIQSLVRNIGTRIDEVYGQTIRSLNDNIDDLRKNQIMDTKEGTQLTLENCANAVISDVALKGQTEQVSYSGKNLLPNMIESGVKNGMTVTVDEDKTITLNGTMTSGNSWNIATNYSLTAGTYTLNLGLNQNVYNKDYYLRINDANSTNILESSINFANPVRTFTINEDMSNLRVYMWIGGRNNVK